jgi:hypothetical protein
LNTNKARFVDALRARLREVAPEIRRTWDGDNLERWWDLVKSEPAFRSEHTPDVALFVRGMCTDLFGPNAND